MKREFKEHCIHWLMGCNIKDDHCPYKYKNRHKCPDFETDGTPAINLSYLR